MNLTNKLTSEGLIERIREENKTKNTILNNIETVLVSNI